MDIKGGTCIPRHDDSFLNFVEETNTFTSTDGDAKPCIRIGNLICKIGIKVSLENGSQADVAFYDITQGTVDRVPFYENSFAYSPPLWPIIACSGSTVVTLC